LRRTKAILEGEIALPPPELVTYEVLLDDIERSIYDLVICRFTMGNDFEGVQMNPFQLVLRLRQIYNYGVNLLPANLHT